MPGWPVIGTREQIVDTYLKLADTGIDGVLTSWARYREGMEEFATDTYPLMVEAGLRQEAVRQGRLKRGDALEQEYKRLLRLGNEISRLRDACARG